LLEPSPQATVLELGAGKGIFTAELAKRFQQVVALELDEKLLEEAKSALVNASNITWVHGDMKEVDPEPLAPSGSILAGNLPYNISGIMVARIATWRSRDRTAFAGRQTRCKKTKDGNDKKMGADTHDLSYTGSRQESLPAM